MDEIEKSAVQLFEQFIDRKLQDNMTHLDPMLMKLITNGLRQTMCPCFLLFLEHPQGGFTCCT